MKSTELIKPTVLDAPLAYRGDKSVIPNKATGSNGASIEEGFPSITSLPISQGGLPPERADFNGLFYLSTDQKVYLQNGGVITFSEDVSNAIGGYPKGAVLDYIDNFGNYSKVLSLIDDNTYNFVTNPNYIDDSHWKILLSEALMLSGKITNCILEAPNGVATYSGNTITLKQGLKVLMPNGRNADGTLKNFEYTLSSDLQYDVPAIFDKPRRIITIEYNSEDDIFFAEHDPEKYLYGNDANKPVTLDTQYWYLYYAVDTNVTYVTNGSTTANWVAKPTVSVASIIKNSSEITSLTPFKTFRAVDYNDTEFIAHQAMPSVQKINISVLPSEQTYTAPADGYFYATVTTSSGTKGDIFLSLVGEGIISTIHTYYGPTNRIWIPVKKGEVVQYVYSAAAGATLTASTLTFVYAQGATND